MNIITADLETYWSQTHSLSKMLPITYCMHPETEIISLSLKVNNGPTTTVLGPDVPALVAEHDFSNAMLIGHNLSAFDSMILAWRLGIKPKMWGCTLAMARPIHNIDVGGSLAALVKHYGLGVKDNRVLLQTKGRHLADFTDQEKADMLRYNGEDVDQCYALFQVLRKHYTAKELWHIDATIRMLVEPRFQTDVPLLETALSIERDLKKKAILQVAKELKLSWFTEDGEPRASSEVEEEVRAQLASAPKFASILESRGVATPMKPSPSDPDNKMVPALAKTDQAFIDLQEHEDPVVAAAARARRAVKSALLETRIQTVMAATEAAGGKLPVPLHYCGASTTGRWSGWAYNCQNLPAIRGESKPAHALRNSMKAPKGHSIVVADLSGIELRVNMFLWKVPYAMELFRADPEKADLYKALASDVFSVPVSEVTKMQRQAGKAQHLGCGFGLGNPDKFRAAAKTMAGLEMDVDTAAMYVFKYREKHPEIVQGWRTCGSMLPHIQKGLRVEVDPWGLCKTEAEGIRLPSGRLIRYPSLRKEDDGFWPDGRPRTSYFYGLGRHKASIAGPKVDENCVQALARDVIADDVLEFFKVSGLRPALTVHDEAVYVVPTPDAQAALDTLQGIMRTPPKWWPELVTWSEGDIAPSYGAAK